MFLFIEILLIFHWPESVLLLLMIEMQKNNSVSFRTSSIDRKTFFKWASLALLIPFYKVWHSAVASRQKIGNNTRELQVNAAIGDGVHFFDKIILIKSEDKIHLLSSKCSHLGCRIDKVENSELVCPCHGSRYDLNGKPMKGPAAKALEEIKFEPEIKKDLIIFRFKNG